MKKCNSIFAQMLRLIPRYEFQKAVRTHRAERHSKGFSSWTHFVSLLFGQLSGQEGLRGVETGMAAQKQKLYHLGVRAGSEALYPFLRECSQVARGVYVGVRDDAGEGQLKGPGA